MRFWKGLIVHIHIDWSKTAMGDRAADGAGQCESRVESETTELLRGVGRCHLFDRVQLRRAGRCWRSARHY